MRIKGLSKIGGAAKFFWVFAWLALISGGAALLTQYLAVQIFGWTSSVHRERREIEVWNVVKISSADTPLRVYTHKGEKIIVEYTGETALIVEENEFELRIGREEDFALSLFSKDKLNYKMSVWLPERYFEAVELVSASGDIYAENIRAALISFTSRSGNVELFGIEGLIAVGTRQGDVKAEFVNFTDSCAIEAETGEVRVIMPPRFGVKLDFLSNTGRFTSDFFRKDYDAYRGDLYLSAGANPIRFTIRTTSGNAYFHERIETAK